MKPSELGCVVIDKTLQPKAVSFRPTQAAQPGTRAAGASGQKDRPEPAQSYARLREAFVRPLFLARRVWNRSAKRSSGVA